MYLAGPRTYGFVAKVIGVGGAGAGQAHAGQASHAHLISMDGSPVGKSILHGPLQNLSGLTRSDQSPEWGVRSQQPLQLVAIKVGLRYAGRDLVQLTLRYLAISGER